MRQISLIKEVQDDAIRFGNEANLSRAIPYVRDGLKPSQRYTIYTAYNHNYSSNKPHVKSAKLDGQITGEAWPHGSEYPTIVRLTQPFVMNIPLLDMHGSNGSQLSTPDAAASRYTEVRLSEACEDGLLGNIKKGTCDWVPNYSEDLELPKILPALLPNLFVNGSDGMGFCYSQTWLPGNLNEFYEQIKLYLKGKKLDYSNIYPDFPTSGIIINKKDVHTIYETGKGTVVLRGKASVNKNIIKITELPYQVYVSDYMQQLKNLITSNKISGISNIYNMSGDMGMNIEIECEEDPNVILNKLYQYSNLQISLSANQYGIVDSIPQMLTLKDYIKVYVDHNIECINREYKFDLDKAEAMLEIVTGLIRAIKVIDKIIDTIKSSKSSEFAKQELIDKFGFTENQSKAIVDMRLGKLANLEAQELADEEVELENICNKCRELLSDPNLQQKEFLKRITEFTKKYGWERRTEVTDIDFEAEKAAVKISRPKLIERFFIALTKGNNIKRIPEVSYKPQTKIVSDTDKIITAINCESKDRFILISSSGMMYKLSANKIDLCNMNSLGTSLNTLLGEKIIKIYSGNETEEDLFFVTKQGQVKKIKTSDVFNISKNVGVSIMKLDEGDEIFDCQLTDGSILKYQNGKKVVEIDTNKYQSKSRFAGGVKCIKVKPDQEIKIVE